MNFCYMSTLYNVFKIVSEFLYVLNIFSCVFFRFGISTINYSSTLRSFFLHIQFYGSYLFLRVQGNLVLRNVRTLTISEGLYSLPLSQQFTSSWQICSKVVFFLKMNLSRLKEGIKVTPLPHRFPPAAPGYRYTCIIKK